MSDNRKKSRRRRSIDEAPELKPIEKSIAKYLRFQCPTKKGMLMGVQVVYFNGAKAIECLTESKWSSISTKALTGDSKKESKHPVCFSSKHAPEGRAHAAQREPAGRHQVGDECGLAAVVVLHRRGQAAADGAQQRKAGHRQHQFLGEGGDQAHHGTADQPQRDVEHPGHHAGGVAARRVLAGFAAHADGGGDGRQVQRITSERCQHRGRQPGGGDGWRHRDVVARRALRSHAGQVLRRHGHHEQRQRHAHRGRQAELRRGEDRRGPGPADAAQVQLALQRRQRHARQQHTRHRVTRPGAPAQQVGQAHHPHQQRLRAQRQEGIEGKTCQHTGQQGRGQ